MTEARVTEKGFSLNIFFATAVVLPCRIDCGCRHVALVKGDSFTVGFCGRREIARVKSVSAAGRTRGNALLNILNYVPWI